MEPRQRPGVVRVTSPDGLVERYGDLHAHLRLEELAAMLADDFRFDLQAATIADFQLPDDHFDRDQELRLARAMFSGEAPAPGVPAVLHIGVGTLAPLADWTRVEEGTYAGTMSAPHAVRIQVDVADGEGTRPLIVEGRLDLYVRDRAGSKVDAPPTRYDYAVELVAIVDRTDDAGKAVSTRSWGSVQAAYLTAPQE